MDSWDIVFAKSLRKYSFDKTLFLKVDIPLGNYHTSVLNKQELFNTLRPLLNNHNKIIMWYNGASHEQLHRDLKQLANSSGCVLHFNVDNWEWSASYAWCSHHIEQTQIEQTQAVVFDNQGVLCRCSNDLSKYQHFLLEYNNSRLIEDVATNFENYTDIKKYSDGVFLEIVSDHKKLPTRKTFVPMIYGIPFLHIDIEIDDVLTAQGFQTYTRFLDLDFPVSTTQLEHITNMISFLNTISGRIKPHTVDAIIRWNQNLIAYKFEQLARGMDIQPKSLIDALIHLDD